MSTSAPLLDYYEFLQISPNADAETIHRVYRSWLRACTRTTTKLAMKRTSAC
ncbi:MAG: hypothetical protein WDM87_15270 [Terracidiphilus sp.]